jgi:hypothetical protein
MLIFVSSPYRGDIRANVEKAKQYCRYVISQGHTPFAPHLLYPQLCEDDRTGIDLGLDVLVRCDEVWQFGGMTAGMMEEGRAASMLRVPVFVMIENGDGYDKVLSG